MCIDSLSVRKNVCYSKEAEDQASLMHFKALLRHPLGDLHPRRIKQSVYATAKPLKLTTIFHRNKRQSSSKLRFRSLEQVLPPSGFGILISLGFLPEFYPKSGDSGYLISVADLCFPLSAVRST